MSGEKPQYHVVSFSGGKDSTAMLLRMAEEGMPIDEIIFCDTGLEFPEMYDHVRKVEETIGRKVTMLHSEKPFEWHFAERPLPPDKNEKLIEKYGARGKGLGWASSRMRWCTGELKQEPLKKHLKELEKTYDVMQYVGLAADEEYRMSRACNRKKVKRYPLIDWGMTEADCLKYCYERGFDWGGLYESFHRVSCWCCPLQRLSSLRVLYEGYPDLWARLKKLDDATWRSFKTDGTSVEMLEKRFELEKRWLAEGKQIKGKEFFKALHEIEGR